MIVGTVKKSMAAIASRWFRRKASQRLARSGSFGARFIQREMVLSERSNPSMRSSPWIRGAPQGGVLNDHTEDQLPNLLRCRSSSNLPPDSGDHPPVHAKTTPVPADHGFGRNDDAGQLPSRPGPSSDYPEEFIEEAEARARMSTFQHRELLAKHEILQNKIPAATEEANQCSDPEEKQAEHGKEL
jgi:hypothetical protein